MSKGQFISFVKDSLIEFFINFPKKDEYKPPNF